MTLPYDGCANAFAAILLDSNIRNIPNNNLVASILFIEK